MSEKEQEQQYPSLPEQGKNLSDAIARSFKDMLEGQFLYQLGHYFL